MGLRQSMRPRHQVLVFKCYPRYQKSTTEVKPNSSELSYLLYYASTRRSKLQKVGEFLDHRTQVDVRKAKLGNVQVTLQILTALIEKCPRDLPLYASYVLNILSTLLNSGDVNFVEESIQAFAAFCGYHDPASMSADVEHTRRYDEIVRTYCSFASKRTPTPGKSRGSSVPESLRFRSAGLKAIKALVSSESFAADDKHIKVVMPSILENLWSQKPGHFRLIERRENADEQHEKELSLRRRQSMSAQRSTEIQRTTDLNEADPSEASVSTADVDRRANEEAGVVALKSLRSIFAVDNRGQVRMAATAALNFAVRQDMRSIPSTDSLSSANAQSNWAIELFETVCRWTPVQDRFVIVTTAMESLTSNAVVDSALSLHSNIVSTVASLLRSDINFIGLSALDVLLGLMQHALAVLQLGRHNSTISPVRQKALAENVLVSQTSLTGQGQPLTPVQSNKDSPTTTRTQLLEQLKDCMGDLATHVYYSDQISDMVSALMSRLKPSTVRNHGSTAAAIGEDPNKSVDAIPDSNSHQEITSPDGFFSFATARLLGLRAIKRILQIANSQRSQGSNVTGRSRVDVSIWEGSQWLLKDPEPSVRHAYVDSLLTWLRLELEKKYLRLVPETDRQSKSKAKGREQGDGALLARRVLSNASQRLRAETRNRNSFIELLHLVIYENALAYSDSEPDIIHLHVLLVHLVQYLGVNSVRSGLPMIFRLQRDIQTLDGAVPTVSVASLVLGYFWAIARFFEFENTALGHEITGEIGRRSTKSCWLKSIRMPPLPLDDLESPDAKTASSIDSSADGKKLRQFDDRQDFVDHIATGYSLSVSSPPNSPPASPQRTLTRPSVSGRATTTSIPTVEKVLPSKVKEQMLENWSRESCLAAAETDLARTTSVSGSKSGSGSGRRSGGGGDTRVANGSPERTSQPIVFSGFNQAYRLQNEFENNVDPRFSGARQGVGSVVRIEDLKRALSGNPDVIQLSSRQSQEIADTASESMITASFSASESSLVAPNPPVNTTTPPNQRSRSGSLQEPPPPTVPAASAGTWREADALHNPPPPVPDEDVPPVPMLPASLRATNTVAPVATEPVKPAPQPGPQRTIPPHSANEASFSKSSAKQSRNGLKALLDDLDITPKRRVSVIDTPPY